MVLEYHRVGDPSSAPEWTITPEDFRSQLQYLYDEDYHPINLRDMLEHEITVPAGKTPVVLTFDDSSDSQFTAIPQDGRLVPDPQSAVGVLADFHESHPDWPMRATFFVLPGASSPNDMFGQPDLAGAKLRYLISNGMEVGNHTLWHQNLSKVTDAEVQEQLALGTRGIHEHIPEYGVVSLALPFGGYPRNEALLRAGSHDGTGYILRGAVTVSGGSSYPPGDRRFDPYHIPRIQAEPTKEGTWYYFFKFDQNPEQRYVSDGDPATVSFPEGVGVHLDLAALVTAGKTVREYSTAPPRVPVGTTRAM
jgi:peptidoglycan/xylan/chitin deacetylase (PgdA/CDA1 family)